MMCIMTSANHPADRLCETVDRIGAPLCVGLDPVQQRMPVELQDLNEVEAFRIFCGGVLDAVSGIAVAVKFQSACFERMGSIGVALLGTLRQDASDKGLQVILDAKRGDIGISAAHYAAAATVEGPCDWITVNPYLGIDGIEPFLDAGLGVFCLARTSNPSGDAIQLQQLKDGTTVAESIAELLAICGDKYLGNSGWSSLGAVVGATKPKEAAQLRTRMRKQIFLMPGIGAQGASVKDLSACFSQGHGALVTASRSVIYPPSDTHWQNDIANAAKKLSDELQVGAL